MSYSFSVRAPTSAEALQLVLEKLDKVVAAQPVHEADLGAAEQAAEWYIKLFGQPGEGNELVVSMQGSVGTSHPDGTLVSASVGLSISVAPAVARPA